MGCERFVSEDGKSIGFACSRRGAIWSPCSVPGCGSQGKYLCDFPLKGKKEGQTCDRRVCSTHAKLIRHNTHYCPIHVKMSEAEE